MVNNDYICLPFLDLEKLKEIGAGTDGKVFNYNGILLKIYRKNLYSNIEFSKLLHQEDKIYNKNKVKFKDIDNFKYYQKNEFEEIRIRADNAVKMAVKKQKCINRTSLPKGSVYLDNKFAGIYLKKAKGIQIHKLTGMPLKYKYKIIKNLILDVEELLNNYIYHIDLHNSPYSVNNYTDNSGKPIFIKGHSHIFVNPITYKTSIIDLDGKSTIYKETKDDLLEQNSVNNLSILITEFLYKIDRDELKEPDEIYYELKKYNIPQEYSRKLADNNFNNFKELKKSMKI